MAGFQFDQWTMGILAALVAAGVIGLFRLSTVVAALVAKVEGWTKTFDEKFITIETKIDDHVKRIGTLETKTSVIQTLLRRAADEPSEG